MSPPRFQTFEEFWPFYVREHSRPATRFWHFCGTTLALALLIVAAASQRWLLLLAVPICGYAFAWGSHMLIERNRPATFSHPLWSLWGDFKMWALIATGRMPREARRILESKPD